MRRTPRSLCRLLLFACLCRIGVAHPVNPSSRHQSFSFMLGATQRMTALRADQQQTPCSRLEKSIAAQQLGPWFLLTVVLIAFSLGGLHALQRGNGNPFAAAPLVGSRNTPHRNLLATAAQLAAFLAFGALTVCASTYLFPGQFSPWLGLLCGITIAGLGVYLLLRRLLGTAASHTHAGDQAGLHLPFRLFRSRSSHQAPIAARLPRPGAPTARGIGRLLTQAVFDGIVCRPAALVILLSAFALQRVGLGLALILAFSVGLAAVLIGSQRFIRAAPQLPRDGPLTHRWAPGLSATLIALLGLLMALQAVATTHFTRALVSGFLSRERLGPVLFLTGLGLVLGMRHSTDPDHVVAISTIVSKQRSIRNAALIGTVWGFGHTIMIFAVGALIILAGMKIPPRVGLAMEFTVALMLVLLGSLNLTGVTRRFMDRYTPKRTSISSDESELPADVSPLQRFGVVQFVRPLVIGLVHGLAGSAAVALLVLSTIHNPVWATIYLLIFGFGTVLGMMIMTAVIAVPLTYAGDRFSNLSRYFGITSGVISMCFGLFLVYQLGFVGGLFTSHPHWTPQ